MVLHTALGTKEAILIYDKFSNTIFKSFYRLIT